MLTVRNVAKKFGDTQVLRGVELSVNKGDVIAIIGQSGGGKTTLLRCINFLETADSGEMEFDGEHFQLNHISKRDIQKIRRKTAFVFQSYNLFRNKTALQNVMLGLTVARKIPKAQAQEIARAALDKVGLADKADSYPNALSGGQQQRVAIARALATSPEIIYFDEPTSALDPELTGEVLRVIRGLKSAERTIIIVTHEMEFAKSVSDRVIFMADGVIEEEGTPQQVFGNPQSTKTRQFLSSSLEKF